MDNLENPKKKRVYGRKLGRPMHKSRLDVLETLLPQVEIPKDWLTEKGDLTLDKLFAQKPERVHFEIGFGNGEHVIAMMKAYPNDAFIAAEPFINGMSAFLKTVRDENLPIHNLRVLMDDALLVLNSLPDASVDVLYILNPDPWPKSRHHKRRIVSEDNLKIFARALKDGGEMVQTTDVDDLAEWMLTKTVQSPDFDWQAEKPEDWKTPPAGWLATRYETKGSAAGRTQRYLIYRRKPRG
jgi:tRNA (guanine-N7-)-methyltransferase